MKKLLLTLVLCMSFTLSSYANQTIEQEVKNKIDNLDKSNLKQWFVDYKQIQYEFSDRLDTDETIHDIISDKEFEFACSIIEAEAGVCDWNGKLNVACVLVNRYNDSSFPNTFTKIIKEKHQFSTYSNGAYKKVKVSDDSRLALEFAYQIGDVTGNATYFHSGKSKWHKNNLKFISNDGFHSFYKVKE